MSDIELNIMRYLQFLERQGKVFCLVLGVVFSCLTGIIDHITPNEAIFSIMYLLPISLSAWLTGKRTGNLVALLCGTIWSFDNPRSKSIFILAWNFFSITAAFLLVSILVAKVRQMLESEKKLASKDPLTGVMNMRAFSEVVDYEILRLQRENNAFSLAYLDLDNFKAVNDCYGHKMGDILLKSFVDCLTENLRKTDVVARAGGDEFILFFPDTGRDAVRVVLEKIQEKLSDLAEINRWPVTVSAGVMSCSQGGCTLDEIISAADKLMYEVKATGKNNIWFSEFPSVDTP
jgi:diguanylate cyclase (GGDEF)-like protein